jgi:hypothetical protein
MFVSETLTSVGPDVSTLNASVGCEVVAAFERVTKRRSDTTRSSAQAPSAVEVSRKARVKRRRGAVMPAF